MGVQANELRIGNWIYNAIKEPFCVDNIYEDCVNKRIDDDFVEGGYLLDLMQPIPLTPEIITDVCLFEKADQGFEYGDGEQVYRLITQMGGYLFMILAGHQWCGAAYIKYLHQLQNLMYSLLHYDIEIYITKLKTETPSKPQ